VLALCPPAASEDMDPFGNGWYPSGFPAYCENHPADCAPVTAELISLPANGDCEDYALTKIHRLAARGIPRALSASLLPIRPMENTSRYWSGPIKERLSFITVWMTWFLLRK
jgi:predicted transglutaminase-like cysteine proteinase